VALTSTTLPSGVVATPYSQLIGIAGGTPPYNCLITEEFFLWSLADWLHGQWNTDCGRYLEPDRECG